MANDKAGTGKGGTRPTDKSGGKPDPKKPTAIIDLKATEVASEDGSSTNDPVKGSAKATVGDKTPASGPAAKPNPTAVPQTAQKSPSEKTGSPADASAGRAAGQTGGQTGGQSSPATKSSSAHKESGKVDQKTASGDAASREPPGPTAPPRGGQPKSGGGGFWSTMTHLAAGFAGGALVLLAAQPIEEQLGIEFIPRAALPADFSNRLSALESRPVAPNPANIEGLASRIEATEGKLNALDDLQQKVVELANQQPSAQSDSDSDGAAAAAELAGELKLRLEKMEQTLETLANATGGGSGQASLGELATLSGKLADIESTVSNQIAALRDSVAKELDERVTKTAEASAAAQAGTQRLDRELANVKTDAARLAQRSETLKAAQDSLSQAVRVAREEAAKLRVDLDGLKGDVLQQFQTVARATDVTSALKPVASRIDTLNAQLKGVVESEAARKASAQRIVIALELGNLKRSLDRGDPYAAELAEVKQIAGGALDLATLEKFQSRGVPTAAELRREFSGLAYAIINAAEQRAEGTMFDRLIGGAKSLVRVRRADLPASDSSTEATVARMERQLQQGNLSGVLSESGHLSDKARKPAQDWLDRVAARAEVDRAIAAIEQQLKSSLGSKSATKG